jgi:hypothetical protein
MKGRQSKQTLHTYLESRQYTQAFRLRPVAEWRSEHVDIDTFIILRGSCHAL